ncbi:MAG: transcriptional repressor [Chloroflexales bacterium]|nr:transcriptional repressor [Chloroflexales bacterium]
MTNFDATALLRQQGHRATPQRVVVLTTLRAQHEPITADELHTLAQAQQPSLDLATVYRVLQFLQQAGLAALLTLGSGPQRFKYRDPGDFHHHLVCKQCSTQRQVPDSLFANMRAELNERYGFTLQIDHMLLPGLCAACQAAAHAE